MNREDVVDVLGKRKLGVEGFYAVSRCSPPKKFSNKKAYLSVF